MYIISKQFTFSASHQLEHLPATHPCSRLHGHNYIIEVVLKKEELDANAFVLDYNELSLFNKFLNDTFDHKHLNEILECYPTAENLAKYLYNWTKKRWDCVSAVRVSETPKTWAIYEE